MSAIMARFSVQGGPQGRGDVPVVALGDQRHDRRAGLAQRGHLRVVGGHRTRAAGSSRTPRACAWRELEFGAGPPEELGVLGDRAGPAALDEADAELVQAPRDGQLVGDGQGQALLLGTVAQRGVVDVETVVGHLMIRSVWDRAPAGQSKRPLAGCERSARRRVRAWKLRGLLGAGAPADNDPAARHAPSLPYLSECLPPDRRIGPGHGLLGRQPVAAKTRCSRIRPSS